MPPKPASTTARDFELLVFAWQSLKTSPQVDYDAFAQKAGYKNAATATTQFSILKKKLFAIAAASSAGTTANTSDGSRPGTPSTPSRRGRGGGATPGSRKRGGKAANAEDASDSAGERVDGSPSKRRKTAARVTAETGDDAGENDDDADTGE